MRHVRVAAAQLNTVVGDLAGNVTRVLDALAEADQRQADLCVFPELAITGYPPEDLLLKPGFVRDNRRALEEVASETGECVAVVGFVDHPAGDDVSDPDPGASVAAGEGFLPPPQLANAAAVCWRGEVVGVYRKRLLPNYGVFDERRWFVPGNEPLELVTVAGTRVGVSICEDVWMAEGPLRDWARGGAELVVNLNASPYSRGRGGERLEMLCRRVAETGCDLVYVNQVGGQDELVFDGGSLVVLGDGELWATAPQFAESLLVVDLPRESPQDPQPGSQRDSQPSGSSRPSRPVTLRERHLTSAPRSGSMMPRPVIGEALTEEEEIYRALVLGTRDYLGKNGFDRGVVLGLSGGIDSALVATIATDALGAGQVHALAMPSRYSSEGSLTDAAAVAENLRIDLTTVPIEEAHRALATTLEPVLDGPPGGLTDENLQSRIRGLLLMTVSNATGWIVLTTGNKSEMATGYSTLYGDSAGGFAVIKDVAKTLVYRLCRHRNEVARGRGERPPIPTSILEKPPSAELRPDQRDDESLPPYEVLDPVLAEYVEHDRTATDLVAEGHDADLVEHVVRLVDLAEYKRRQMPPGVRITTKAFGKDRRMPITNHYRAGREVTA